MQQLVAVICSKGGARVTMGFPNPPVVIYRLEGDGKRTEFEGAGTFDFTTGVWAFKVAGPVAPIESRGPATVLITDEDPWPKPPPPPPPGVFKDFHEYIKHFNALEEMLRGA